ncbi:MAG: methyltransferase family protein [Proteobacteria bacterium]|nr:methyltransferase family protein [Pseudomonadota bacterium]
MSTLCKHHIPCPICGSADCHELYPDTLGDRLPDFDYDFSPSHRQSFRTVRCEHCGHGYSSPLPADLYANYVDVEDKEYMRNREQRRMTAVKVLSVIRRFKPGGALLDVGCATGDFLDVARESYDAEGLELSKWAADVASRTGAHIYRQRLSDMPENERYDVVTLWGVIEHFETPQVEIAGINRLLKYGGLLCLWTGDLDSWVARFLGKRWWYVQGQHIQMFTMHSLEKLMQENGFVKKEMSRYPYVMSLRSIAKSLSRYKAIGTLASLLLDNSLLGDVRITLKLPGEMFGIFEKVAPAGKM